jgi:hypothetical protein
MTAAPSKRGEAAMAWIATLASVAYYLWVGAVSYKQLPEIAVMYEGLGVQGGAVRPYLFLGRHPWIMIATAIIIGAALIAKEILVRDKRRSIVITCLVAVLLLILIDVYKALLIRPLSLTIDKLVGENTGLVGPSNNGIRLTGAMQTARASGPAIRA